MEIEKFLKDKNIKITKGRLAIYNILKKNKNSINADYIYEECKKKGIKLNLSTVYRTIEIFEEKKLIEKISLGDGKFSYAIKKNEHKHMLKCNVCEKEVEIPCPMRSITELVQNQTGFMLTEHQLVMKGVCEQCKHKNNNNKFVSLYKL